MSIINLPLVPLLPANGQVGDAVPLDQTINYIVSQVNANAQPLSAAVTNEWQPVGVTPTYISATQFSIPGNYVGTVSQLNTAPFAYGRHLQTQNTAGLVYSIVTAAAFAAGVTTVTVKPYFDSGAGLDSGLSAIFYSIIGAYPSSRGGPAMSFCQALWIHGTDTLASGTAKIVGTNNNFTLASLNFNNMGEYNTATGVFTPGRFGWFLITQYAQVNTSGVTFSGSCLVGTSTAGVMSGPVQQDMCANLQANRASATNAYIDYISTSVNLSLITTFSAGTPVFVQGVFTIIGPL